MPLNNGDGYLLTQDLGGGAGGGEEGWGVTLPSKSDLPFLFSMSWKREGNIN